MDLEHISRTIYANVLTIMGILVAIFSLLSINYQAFSQAEVDLSLIITMNLTIALSVTIMFGLIFAFINQNKTTKFTRYYIILVSAKYVRQFGVQQTAGGRPAR